MIDRKEYAEPLSLALDVAEGIGYTAGSIADKLDSILSEVGSNRKLWNELRVILGLAKMIEEDAGMVTNYLSELMGVIDESGVAKK
jgi:hypothetical protein